MPTEVWSSLRLLIIGTLGLAIAAILGLTGWLLWPVFVDYRNPVRVAPKGQLVSQPVAQSSSEDAQPEFRIDGPLIIEELFTVEGTFTHQDGNNKTMGVVHLVRNNKDGTPVIYQSAHAKLIPDMAGRWRFESELKAPPYPGEYEVQVIHVPPVVGAVQPVVGRRKVQIVARPPHLAAIPTQTTQALVEAEKLPDDPPSPEEAIQAVFGAIGEKHWPRITQTSRVARHVQAGKALTSALLKALAEDPSPDPNLYIRAFFELGADAKEAIPALTKVVREAENHQLRWTAIWALGCIGPDAEAAVPDLIECLHEQTTRSVAARGLGCIGPGAKDAVPELARLIREAQEDINYIPRATRVGLVGIGPDAVPILAQMLGDADEGTRRRASIVLAELGPMADSAAPSLCQAVTDKAVRDWSAVALGRIGPEAKSPVPLLIKALQDEDDLFRVCAARALGGIGPEANEAITPLTKLLKYPDRQLRQAAEQALFRISPDDRSKSDTR